MARPPLQSLRVLELAGLAPVPFTGMLLADAGASVLRVDRPRHSPHPPRPTSDQLTRRKSSIALDLKKPASLAILRDLIVKADVLIDPYRPGVLEKLGLGPADLHCLNPRLIIARVTGFRRSGKYAGMAGHDINYLAVSGVLSLLGERDQRPLPPGNVLADFAGGGHVAFTGILLALLHRGQSGHGQVVEANMVDGVSYLATFPRLNLKTPLWSGNRGTNALDGGAPYYDCYQTADSKWVSVGALEPQFFRELVKKLGMQEEEWPEARRLDWRNWNTLRSALKSRFRRRTRKQWEDIFDGSDACVAPVLGHEELEDCGYDQRPLVGLTGSPLLAVSDAENGSNGNFSRQEAGEGIGPGVAGQGWRGTGLRPGEYGERVLEEWTGWKRGKEYDEVNGELIRASKARL
ncbi:MAG: hypothetical protein Q9162_004025 [Coniocarpon cinnabarinum]